MGEKTITDGNDLHNDSEKEPIATEVEAVALKFALFDEDLD